MPAEYVWLPRRKFQDRRWLHLLLFVLTIASTTFVGIGHWAAFAESAHLPVRDLGLDDLIIRGLWYSGSVLAILGFHELGHYLACRYYDVDASLPYFLPLPLISLIGTLGAFIRIREPIPTKRMLFDIGIAGPIAGFVVAVPVLFLGLAMSTVEPFPRYEIVGFLASVSGDVPVDGWNLGEPLLFKLATRLVLGSVGEGFTVNLHPVAFGAWFGLLATFMNLFPIAQLDGGHISYAVLGRHSSKVTLIALACAFGIAVFSPGILIWALLLTVMLWRFGRHHPPTFDGDLPLDATRSWLALVALVIFVLCFMPAPIQTIHILH